MGALSASRSVFGVVLPFPAVPMYNTLGVNGTCSPFGTPQCVDVYLVIPFLFLKLGVKIREKSEFGQELHVAAEQSRGRSEAGTT
jgi:hypothetical protein